MKKKTMVYTGLALGAATGGAAFIMMNKNARKKAEHMIDYAVDETRNYFAEM